MSDGWGKFLNWVGRKIYADNRGPRIKTVHEILWNQAREEAALFAKDHIHNALLFKEADHIRDFALRDIPSPGMIIEFGVYRGHSINLFAERLSALGDQRQIHGFDSFEGLEEHWVGHQSPRGAFNLSGKLPEVADNVTLTKGWVQETLPGFLAGRADEKIAFAHIDTDTYTPCRFILEAIKPRLQSGAVILFDEFYGYPNWRNNEYKALLEVFDEDAFDYIAFASEQAAIRIR